MKENTLNKAATFAALPPEWPHSLLDQIQALHIASGSRLVVLDDDPTGTQTVHDIPLLTEWGIDALREELIRSRTFFVLTNSRSLPAVEAVQRAQEIGQNLKQAAADAGVEVVVLSRSDSTLRGHYPAEVDALCVGIERKYDATVLVPFFEAGGRYTLGDIHYVQQGEELVPAAQTEFARDKAFPFSHSWLPAYVEEKTQGRIRAKEVQGISIQTLREGGPEAVCQQLMQIPPNAVIVINACSARDMEVAVMGLYLAAEQGKTFLYRTAASFVRVLAGMPLKPLLQASEMAIETQAGGVLFVGSHIPKSTAQLARALELPDIESVEIEVSKLVVEAHRQAAIDACLEQITNALQQGKHVIAFTSRKLIATGSAERSLSISRIISRSVCEIVQRLPVQPRFFIAKGGITSNDIATIGLQVRRAEVVGQLQPGVPVWKLGPESKFPGMHYVVYPGNVGSESGLADAVQAFS